MSITEVHGTRVDCHICRVSHHENSEPEAHAWAQGHAESHEARHQAYRPPSAPHEAFRPAQEWAGPNPPRHLALAQPSAFPRHAKTTIPHGRYILLTILTGGLYLPWYLKAWFRAGRKTTFS